MYQRGGLTVVSQRNGPCDCLMRLRQNKNLIVPRLSIVSFADTIDETSLTGQLHLNVVDSPALTIDIFPVHVWAPSNVLPFLSSTFGMRQSNITSTIGNTTLLFVTTIGDENGCEKSGGLGSRSRPVGQIGPHIVSTEAIRPTTPRTNTNRPRTSSNAF